MASPTNYRKRSRVPRKDLYADVTDRIVQALEDGVAPWVRPWRSLGASGDLCNGATGHAYSNDFWSITVAELDQASTA